MDSPELLRERMKIAKQTDELPGALINGVLALIQEKRGAESVERVKASLQSKRIYDWFRYPAAELLRVLDAGATEFAQDGLSYSDAIILMATGPGDRFADSPVGKTLSMFAGVDPHRGLSVVASTYKATFTFGSAAYSKLTDRSARVVLNGELIGPAWSVGLFRRGLKNMHKVDTNIDLKMHDPIGTNYELTFSW